MRRFTSLLLLFPFYVWAQTPMVDPSGVYIVENDDGTADTTDLSGDGTTLSAPLKVILKANPSGLEGYGTPRYEWKVWNDEDPETLILHRTEENIEHTFTSSGSFTAQLYVTFYNADGSVYYEFPEEGADPKAIHFSISKSIFRMPFHLMEMVGMIDLNLNPDIRVLWNSMLQFLAGGETSCILGTMLMVIGMVNIKGSM